MRQLEVKKVCLLKKMAERRHMANSLPWKRSYDTPQGPPPSRSPSKTNIIWVRVRNSSGEMEIDGFLRTDKSVDELLPRNKNNSAASAIEVKVPPANDGAPNDTTAENKCYPMTEIRDSIQNTEEFPVGHGNEECLDIDIARNLKQGTMQGKVGPQVSCMDNEVSKEQLVPMVKGLKVFLNQIRRGCSVRKNTDEKVENEVYEKHTNPQTKPDGSENRVWKGLVKGAIPCSERENDAKTDSADFVSDWCGTVRSRKNIVGIDRPRNSYGRELSNVGNIRPRIAHSRRRTGSGRRSVENNNENIKWGRSNNARSNSGDGRGSVKKGNENIKKDLPNASNARSTAENGWKRVGSDRKYVRKRQHNIGSKREAPTVRENTEENKSKRHESKSRETGKISPTKITSDKDVSRFVQFKPNVKGVGIFAMNFSANNTPKNKAVRKALVSMNEIKKCSSKARTATRSDEKIKYPTTPPRKSCSACSVKISTGNEGIRGTAKENRSKSDTVAVCKPHRDVGLGEEARGLGKGRKSQSPVPITLPSQTQRQNFDKVANNKLRKTLAVKMRRHCYRKTWAYPSWKIEDVARKETNETGGIPLGGW